MMITMKTMMITTKTTIILTVVIKLYSFFMTSVASCHDVTPIITHYPYHLKGYSTLHQITSHEIYVYTSLWPLWPAIRVESQCSTAPGRPVAAIPVNPAFKIVT